MVIRVFPRRTRATPTDDHAFVGEPGLFVPEGATEVHVSVAFTWDLPRAEELALSWERTSLPVRMGGPALGTRGEEFVPGRYLRPGYVITSRGCPNRCWFCSVWKREGQEVRELPITDGWNVLDDNLLACSEEHIRAVFTMLSRQDRPAEFTGGLEAARFAPWHAELLAGLKPKPKQIFFAYDEEADYEPLVNSGRLLTEAGFQPPPRNHARRAYVLVGYPKDTLTDAEQRLRRTYQSGFLPMAMLWRNPQGGETSRDWRSLQREWARPAIVGARMR